MPKGIKTTEPNIKTICKVCNKEFLAFAKTEKYCCKECAKIAARRQIQENKRLKSIEQYKDTPGIAICKECGFRGHDLYTHIRFAHNLTTEEYCEKYNCTPDQLLSEQTHINRSKAQRNSVNPNKRRFKSGSENPAFNHGGKFSPFSKNFDKYNGLSEEEKEAKILDLAKKANDNKMEAGNCVFTKEYYINHFNMSEDEAEKALSERQSTFSLEKCIERYGDEEGRKIWLERQEKWQKNYKHANYSKISQELFKELEILLKPYNLSIYFATNGEDPTQNNEKVLNLSTGVLRPDFYIDELNLVIEFDGDYWHGTLPSGKSRDEVKNQRMETDGVPYLRVKEKDYRKDKNKVLNDCLTFIMNEYSKKKQ